MQVLQARVSHVSDRGWAVGLGLNTALVVSQDSLVEGISMAFRVDALLAAFGFLVVLRSVHRPDDPPPRPLTAEHRHRHRAHA